MKLVVLSEIPVSYRQGWFDHISTSSSIDLTVAYLAQGQDDRGWETTQSRGHRTVHLESVSLPQTLEGFSARMTPGIGNMLREQAPDFVLVPGWAHPACWQAARWCKGAGVPYGVTLENWKLQGGTRLPSALTNMARNWIMSNAAVALPAGMRAAAYARHLAETPVRILHANVADVETASRGTTVVRSGAPRVVYLGRLMVHKGVRFVFELAPSLAADGIETVVIGDGPERGAAQKCADAGSLTYLGAMAGAKRFELLSAADVVVMPSLEEPWGVVLQEALAAGTPVVATSEVGAADDFLTDGSNGAVVPLDRGSMELAIRSWLTPTEAERAACRASAQTITYSSVTEELEAIVEEFAA